jgi:hypothetical protein
MIYYTFIKALLVKNKIYLKKYCKNVANKFIFCYTSGVKLKTNPNILKMMQCITYWKLRIAFIVEKNRTANLTHKGSCCLSIYKHTALSKVQTC